MSQYMMSPPLTMMSFSVSEDVAAFAASCAGSICAERRIAVAARNLPAVSPSVVLGAFCISIVKLPFGAFCRVESFAFASRSRLVFRLPCLIELSDVVL